MLKSLRSRLLASYALVIAVALIVIALALLILSAISANERGLPALRELNAVALAIRRELLQLHEAGATRAEMVRAVQETADEQKVRILLLEGEHRELVYDSGPGSSLPPLSLEQIQPIRLGPLANTDFQAGRVTLPDGQRWLVYLQRLAARNPAGLMVVVAQPETTPLAFFRNTFLRPLCQAGLVAFLLAILLAWLISRSVARPLQRLAGAAEAIAGGDLEQQVPPEGPEEVKRVASSFNLMAAEVKTTQQAQRDLVANVSHDLKTPLTSIQGWSQALLDETAGSAEERRQAAGIIHDEAARMVRMVGQLLDLARIDSGQLNLHLAPVDLGQLLPRVRQNLAMRAQERQLFFTMELQPVPQVMGDEDRLMQIFTNLADNALAHTPPGGRVHLSLRPREPQAVEVTVQDTGPGIPPEELKRIFERFYQVDKSRSRREGRRGAGLGLAIVRQLVLAHGGRIDAYSRVGQGSAFVVRLPAGPPAGTTVTSRERK